MPLITAIRMSMERRYGVKSVRRGTVAGFESEDFVYLVGPITWIFGPLPFLVVYGCGTIGYLVWTAVRFFHANPVGRAPRRKAPR